MPLCRSGNVCSKLIGAANSLPKKSGVSPPHDVVVSASSCDLTKGRGEITAHRVLNQVVWWPADTFLECASFGGSSASLIEWILHF